VESCFLPQVAWIAGHRGQVRKVGFDGDLRVVDLQDAAVPSRSVVQRF
jgi:hypothetical protein